MWEAYSSETSVSAHCHTQCHDPEEDHAIFAFCENLKIHTAESFLNIPVNSTSIHLGM
jgi:hypothetical protein